MTIEIFSNDAEKLAELANANLETLNGKCREKEEVKDYYLGILRRQAIILLDLQIILKNRKPELITTPFMILR